MTRRMVWLGLLVVASQLSAGCCCWRQHCAGWRLRHCGSCSPSFGGPVYAGHGVGPVVGPGCPSCYTPPVDHAPPPGAVVYGGPVLPPGGPPVAGPFPLVNGPTIEPQRDGAIPQPMPPMKPSN